MNAPLFTALCLGLTAALTGRVCAAEPAQTNRPAPASKATYALSPNDLVLMKVYQEDDLETRARIAKDGTVTIPLIGVVQIGGKTVEEATGQIRDLLDKDYLVNPQVTLSVIEYAKRRFTVLGQVQKPGSYEIPNEESVTLLQAIAMAGGYTRLANPGKITLSRVVGSQKTALIFDGRAMASDPSTKAFEIMPEDTITVAERIF
jgi:protein involved in polysaccharide export with SLBB domain